MINQKYIYSGILAITIALACFQFHRTLSVITFPDTGDYFNVAGAPLFSAKLWAGERPPLYPVFIKLCQGNITAIVHLQLLLSIICWTFLAYCLASVLVNPRAKVIGFTLVQLLTLSQEIAMWHKAILTESLSFSFLAACIGCWLLFARRRSLVTTSAALFTTALCVFIKDSNAYLALLLALSFIAGFLFFILKSKTEAVSARRNIIIAIIALLIMFFVSDRTANNGLRWLVAFYNNIGKRILPDKTYTQWFTQNGMPLSPALRERSGSWASGDSCAFFNDPRLEKFRIWTYKEGKSTYIKWIILHPVSSFNGSISDFPRVLYDDLPDYVPRDFRPLVRFPKRLCQLLTFVFICFVGKTVFYCSREILRRGLRNYPVVIIPLLMVAFLIPYYLVVWIAGEMELMRHAAQTAMQFRIAVILLAVCSLDLYLGSKARISRFGQSDKEKFKIYV